MKKLMVLDGNSLIHRAFHALPLLSTRQGVFTNAVLGFTTMLFKLLKQENPDYIAVAFDEGKTFRHDEYHDYKATRKPTADELKSQFPIIKEILKALNISILTLPGYEADDIIGILTKDAEKEGIEAAVVTGDRDSLQLVSDTTKVIITKKGISETLTYDSELVKQEYGLRPHQLIDVKALMGDKSDNIPGVPGVGEKTAVKLIGQFGSIDNLMANLDSVTPEKLRDKLKDHQEQIYASYRLAEIQRDVPLDVEISDCKYERPNYNDLLNLFENLEFRKLTKEILEEIKDDQEAVVDCEETPDFVVPSGFSQLEGYIKSLEAARPVAAYLATEIKKGSAGKPKLKHIGLYREGEACVFEVDRVMSWEGAKDLIKGFFAEKAEIVFHDGKEAMWALRDYGISVNGDFQDTQLAAYLLNPSASEYLLQQLSTEYLGTTIIEQEDPCENCALYARTIFDLYGVLKGKLEELNLLDLYNTVELPLERVLFEMETNGITVDYGILEEMSGELGSEIDGLAGEIYELAGEVFNINSPKQLGEILFTKLGLPAARKTKTGYSTSAEVLEQLSGKHPIIDKILLHRQLVKLKSTYVDGLSKLIDKNTGRIHTTFNQTITATGRLSSTEPNLQNIPIRMEMGRKIRRVFGTRNPDWVLLAADYSQIELRVLAHLSGDDNLRQAFFAHRDIHSFTASQVFGVDLEDVDYDMRRMAKAVNFGIVYGISDFGLSRDLGISRKEAKAFIDEYFYRYPGVKLYMDKTIAEAREKGYVTTILKRRRYLPDLFSSNRNVRNFGERTAMNTPIQGSAADIMKLAMLEVDRELKSRGSDALMLLQVHDELIFELPRTQLAETAETIRSCMEKAYPLEVPLEVDLMYGYNWYEMNPVDL